MAEASDGSVLLRCHAGCSAVAVVAALGLQLADLFPRPAPPMKSPSRPATPPSRKQLAAAVRAELEAILTDEERDLGFRPAPLSRHLATARRRVAARHNITLGPPLALWWECEPHALDPLWKLLIDRAVEKAALRGRCDIELVLRQAEQSLPIATALIEDAARMLHREARLARAGTR